MNSTKVMKVPHSEQFMDNFYPAAPFKIERFPKHPLKRDSLPKPFPLKKEHVANPTKKRLNEEEKGKWSFNNKENLGYNKRVIGEVVKMPPVSHTPTKPRYFSSSLKKLEKEVKIAQFELTEKEGPGDLYNDERLALENEYGLDQDDIFNFDAEDEYEEQDELAEKYENLNNSHPINNIRTTQEREENQETCDGLKKGIDNDALIADVSTDDEVSLYEDYIVFIKRNQSEGEIENNEISAFDSQMKPDVIGNPSLYDCGFSKAFEEDFEEEKINTRQNKSPSESYLMMVDFKDDDYEMDLEKALHNSPMYEQTVPLMKKSSLRMERGLSLFEDHSGGFLDDFPAELQKKQSRERSYSKFSEDAWYNKEWHNNFITEQSHASCVEEKFEDIQMEEPEFLNMLNKIPSPEQEKEETYDLPVLECCLNQVGPTNEAKDLNTISDLLNYPIEEKDESEENESPLNKDSSEMKDNVQNLSEKDFSEFNNFEGHTHF